MPLARSGMSIMRLVKQARRDTVIMFPANLDRSTLEYETGGMTCVCLCGTRRDSIGQRVRANVHAKRSIFWRHGVILLGILA